MLPDSNTVMRDDHGRNGQANGAVNLDARARGGVGSLRDEKRPARRPVEREGDRERWAAGRTEGPAKKLADIECGRTPVWAPAGGSPFAGQVKLESFASAPDAFASTWSAIAPEVPVSAAVPRPVAGAMLRETVLARPPPIRPGYRRWLWKFALVIGIAGLVAAIGWIGFLSEERGMLELHSSPPNATVWLNGQRLSRVTPVLLTLPAEEHQVVVAFEGHRSVIFSAAVRPGNTPTRRHVDLPPLQESRLMTVRIDVQPVVADITIDRARYMERRTLEIPDLDPAVAHRIDVEAAGYEKVQHRIEPGKLKEQYRYVLQRRAAPKPIDTAARDPVASAPRKTPPTRRRTRARPKKRRIPSAAPVAESGTTSGWAVGAGAGRKAVPKVGETEVAPRAARFEPVPKLGAREPTFRPGVSGASKVSLERRAPAEPTFRPGASGAPPERRVQDEREGRRGLGEAGVPPGSR